MPELCPFILRMLRECTGNNPKLDHSECHNCQSPIKESGAHVHKHRHDQPTLATAYSNTARTEPSE